jgi:hypothetical protein
MTKVKVFEKKVKLQGQCSEGLVHGIKLMKGLIRRNTHGKYESPCSYQLKVMTKAKVFEKIKLQGQRSEGQGHGIK